MAFPCPFPGRRGANCMEIKVEHFLDHLLVGLVRGGLEQIAMAAPHRVHDQHRAEHAGRDRRVHLTELTSADATFDEARNEPQNSFDDFTSVKARKIRKAAKLRVNESKQ